MISLIMNTKRAVRNLELSFSSEDFSPSKTFTHMRNSSVKSFNSVPRLHLAKKFSPIDQSPNLRLDIERQKFQRISFIEKSIEVEKGLKEVLQREEEADKAFKGFFPNLF